ncbi:hypothetical protein BTJ40_13700 [Microbulbifer sp. A4B17]|uniref:hypothetical protein n=1 Tax=Microbulbifer sp. A4B17 TaxID=359370 RepID=UPI000D52AC88|nr:hypothetical protein [Microbulbifer sp. A4B17]AWF81795.1 hypothetical protein BTJ40_13700 [Microbulbifer sp. A4B17]
MLLPVALFLPTSDWVSILSTGFTSVKTWKAIYRFSGFNRGGAVGAIRAIEKDGASTTLGVGNRARLIESGASERSPGAVGSQVAITVGALTSVALVTALDSALS